MSPSAEDVKDRSECDLGPRAYLSSFWLLANLLQIVFALSASPKLHLCPPFFCFAQKCSRTLPRHLFIALQVFLRSSSLSEACFASKHFANPSLQVLKVSLDFALSMHDLKSFPQACLLGSDVLGSDASAGASVEVDAAGAAAGVAA